MYVELYGKSPPVFLRFVVRSSDVRVVDITRRLRLLGSHVRISMVEFRVK